MYDNTLYIQGQETSGTDHISSKDGTWRIHLHIHRYLQSLNNDINN